MLWDFVLWDSVLWDFVCRDFVLWDFVLWDSVPDSLIVLKYILKVLGMYLSTFPLNRMYLYLSTLVVESTCTCT